jgi:hypothetical protein
MELEAKGHGRGCLKSKDYLKPPFYIRIDFLLKECKASLNR